MDFPFTLTRPITWFDLETTGKDPRTARIVEIGITQLQPNGERVNYYTLVNPEIPIPPGATEKHNITDEMVVNAPRFAQIASKIVKAFTDVDLGGFNLKRYDIEVMDAEFKRASVAWNADLCLVMDGYRLWQLMYPRTLTDFVREFLEREPSESHRAVGDATDALEGFIAFVNKHRDKLPATMQELHDLQWPIDPNQIPDTKGKLAWNDKNEVSLTFGKHATVALRYVPRDYLKWLLNTDMTFAMRTIIENGLKRGEWPQRTAA